MSCEYHLVSGIPDDRPLRLDEGTLASCLRRLRSRLRGCARARLPAACELDRIFDVEPSFVPRLARPAGEDCRRENGDEGFDAQFVCADGLHCENGRCVEGPRDDLGDRARCENALDVPFGGP